MSNSFQSMHQLVKQIIAFRLKYVICLYLFVHIYPNHALATNFYVSPSGSDYNLGTLNNPFRTISKGVTKLNAGDFLFVLAGTYVERVFIPQSGTEASPITIKAYPGNSPVIDGEGRLPIGDWSSLIQIEGNYISISGFEVKNSNTNGIYQGGEGVVLVGHHNVLSNMNVHNTWSGGIIAQGDYSIVENCRIWQSALSNSAKPGSSGWSTGLSACRSPVDGITTNAILRGNQVYNNWGEGLSTFEAEGTVIEDNIIYDNWSVNLYISDTRGALVQRNLIYNTPNNIVGQRRPVTLGDERADKPRSANNTVINNLIYNADLWAFWSTAVPGSGLDNVLIANNTIVNGLLEIGNSVDDGTLNKSAIIRNNIFVNSVSPPWEIKGSLAKLTFSNNLWSETPPSGLVGNGDVVGDPKLTKTGSTSAGELSPDYFKILATSPAINNGVGISNVTDDFFQNKRDATPDIGAYEYTILNQKIDVKSITVRNQNGTNTINTYKGTLQLITDVLPANATIKTVTWSIVNGTGQASINASGLVTAVSDGSVTAVATSNDNSAIFGSLVITITNQNVPDSPVFVSSSVENSAPSVIEIVYSINLASILPSASSFSVYVNSVSRNINSVSISGTKVRLTLSAPIVNADLISFSYTKPSSNPLQSVSGGQALSLTAQNVINRVNISDTPLVNIYPNPAQRFINIRIQELTQSPDFIKIFDLSGKVVFQDKVYANIKEFRILLNLINGVYLIQLGTGNLSLFIQKLIINN